MKFKINSLLLIFFIIIISIISGFYIYIKKTTLPFSVDGVKILLTELNKANGKAIKINKLTFNPEDKVGPIILYYYEKGIPQHIKEFYSQDWETILKESKQWAESIKSKGGNFIVEWGIEKSRILSSYEPIFAFSLLPGKDGVCAESQNKNKCIGSIQLRSRQLYENYLSMPGGEFSIGSSKKSMDKLINPELSINNNKTDNIIYYRFSSRSFIFDDDNNLQELFEIPDKIPSSQYIGDLMESSVYAGNYLLKHLRNDGSFQYLYNPITNTGTNSPMYSLPRHAGTIYFLALLSKYTHRREFSEATKKAIDFMIKRTRQNCNGKLCLSHGTDASLGSSAIAVIAMAEYQKANGDRRYSGIMKSLGDFILSLQLPSGRFYHLFNTKNNKAIDLNTLYFDGEAAFALSQLYHLTKDERYLTAAKKVLDYLTGKAWDFFGSDYFYSEEHWTCIAADHIYPYIKSRQYVDFCHGFSKYMKQLQYNQGETRWDATGGQGFTPFISVRVPPTCGRAEALVSIYNLLKNNGINDKELNDQIESTMGFILRHQYKPDDAENILFPEPEQAWGGFPPGAAENHIRIDYVQHCGNAMIRWAMRSINSF